MGAARALHPITHRGGSRPELHSDVAIDPYFSDFNHNTTIIVEVRQTGKRIAALRLRCGSEAR